MSHRGRLLLRRLWFFLSPRRRLQIALLSVLMLGGTFMEMLSLGAVLPYLAVVMDPASALQHPQVGRMAAIFGIQSPNELLGPLTATFIAVALIAAAGRLSLLWGSHRMAFLIGTDLSTEVYRRTLYQPLSVHAARNSSGLIATIVHKVSEATHVFQYLLMAVTSSVMVLGITTALVLINPLLAGLAAIVFGGGYALIGRITRRRLRRNGKRIKETSIGLVKELQEGLGNIRDVLLDGTQPTQVTAYRRVDRPLRAALANNGFIKGSPRVIMDAFGIACIATVAYFLINGQSGAKELLPVLGALALGAQRLLPSFQNIFTGYAYFLGHQASLEELMQLLEQPLPPHAAEPPPPPLVLEREIRFKDLCFRYSETGPWILNDINLVIEKGARIGFVGKTGSGKSTALDLFMGLLEPTTGTILVDDLPLSGTHGRAWQRSVAHVPQSIFLSDATIAENIAIGIPMAKIDMDRVRQAAQLAHVSSFIEEQPDGYKTVVGERGIRLSGGQRQRLGIARALYKQAKVLVFDEATSALDSATERELMDAVDALSRDLTVLMIAHRLSTVERCDKIVVIDQGRIAAVDTYSQLLQTNEIFQSLASQSHPT